MDDNKAIVQIFRSDSITEYGDYQQGFVIEYHLVDLATKTIEKLDVPLSKYPRKALELLANGKAVIMSSTETKGNAYFIYAPQSNSVGKGLVHEGTEYINAFLSSE